MGICLLFFLTLTLSFFCLFLLWLEHVFSLASSQLDVLSSYECGFEPAGLSRIPFCMKFFLLAIIFLVFDVEVSFFVPTLYASSLVFFFTLLLLIGLFLEYLYGGLDWVL